MNHDIAEFAVDYAKKRGAGYAEARLESSATSSFLLKNGVPEISEFESIHGMGMRIITKNALGFVSTNNFEKSRIKELIDRAARSAENAVKISEKVVLSDESVNESKYEVKQKKGFDDVSPKEKISILFEAENAVKETGISVPGRYISLSDTITEKFFVNTEGSRVYSRIPRPYMFYYLTIKNRGATSQRMWSYGATGGFEVVEKWDIPKLITEEVRGVWKNLTEGVSAPKEKLDVVVAPQVVGIMVHESIGHPCEADRIFGREAAQAGESFITKNMIGAKLGSSVITVVDDPTIEGSFGHYADDDEGVSARRKYLLKNGEINELLHNRETCTPLNLKSNGSSRASCYNRESIVRMSNTFLLPGSYKEEELISGVKKGVYIKNFMEWNIDDKRLNQKYVGAEAYMIEGGKTTVPVRSPSIEISTPALWKSVDAVADNTEYHAGTCGKAEPMQAMPVWFGGPSMRMKNVRVC